MFFILTKCMKLNYWDSRVCQIYIQVHKARKCSNLYWEMNLLIFLKWTCVICLYHIVVLDHVDPFFLDKQHKFFLFLSYFQYLRSEDLYMLSLHFLYLPHFFQQTRREKIARALQVVSAKMTRQRCIQLRNWVRTTVGLLQLQ